jgi:hypothetical protein
MVLGESHYGTEEEARDQYFTIELMERVVTGWRYAFWTRVASVFLGRRPTDEDYVRFWQSVMFYNFIQESVGRVSRTRPTPAMWTNAVPAFQEVLERYRPLFILVTGKQLWDNLPNAGQIGPTIALPDRGQRESWLYSHPGGHALSFGINHPQSFGWKYQDWVAWVAAVLEAARHINPKYAVALPAN